MKYYLYPFLLLCCLSIAQAQPIMKAKQAFQQGHYEQAMLHWQTVLNTAQKTNIRLDAQFNIARIYRYLGIYAKALRTINTALLIAQSTGDTAYQALLTNELSKLRQSQGEQKVEQAVKNGEQAVEMARKANNPLVLIEVLNHWGNLLTAEYDYERARETYSEALEILKGIKSSPENEEIPYIQAFSKGITTREIQTLHGKILINQIQPVYFFEKEEAYGYKDQRQAFKGSIAALQSALQATQNWADVYSQALGLITISHLAQKIQLQFKQPSAQ